MRGPRTAMKSGPRSQQLEKALAHKRRPNTAINEKKKKNTKKPTSEKRNIFKRKDIENIILSRYASVIGI